MESFNIPFFDSVSIISGNRAICELGMKMSNNTADCWSSCPRANIFRDQFMSVRTMADMEYMINYNKWQTDPNSLDDPCNAIACRRDLEPSPTSNYPAGGLDGKVSSVLSSRKNSGSAPSIFVRVGPTSDDQVYIL